MNLRRLDRSPLLSLSLPLALALSGCGLLHVRTSGGASDPAAPSSGETGPSEPGASDSAAGGDSALARAYAAWSYEKCPKALYQCGMAFAKTAGDPYSGNSNPPYTGHPRAEANPDPDWLPKWDALSNDDNHVPSVYEALALAAGRKTWLGACHATFDAYWSAQATALAATSEATDKANAIANPYDRLQAFADLPRGPVAVPNDPARYELEAATARAFRSLGRASTYQTEKYYPSVDLRPAFDEASERDLFCWKAAKGLEITEGRVRKLVMPKAPEGDEHLDAIVKPLFDEAKIKPLVEKATAARADAEAFFRMKDAPAAPETKGGTIKTVTRKGDAVVVTLYSESSGVTQDKSRCVWVSAAQVSCPTVNLKTEETTTITFTDLPASITLREGARSEASSSRARRRRRPARASRSRRSPSCSSPPSSTPTSAAPRGPTRRLQATSRADGLPRSRQRFSPLLAAQATLPAMPTEAEAIRAMRAGHARAAERKLELMRTEGPQPGLAALECFAALDALMEAGLWPGPRDPLSERGVAEVRARWAKIGQRARAARGL